MQKLRKKDVYKRIVDIDTECKDCLRCEDCKRTALNKLVVDLEVIESSKELNFLGDQFFEDILGELRRATLEVSEYKMMDRLRNCKRKLKEELKEDDKPKSKVKKSVKKKGFLSGLLGVFC